MVKNYVVCDIMSRAWTNDFSATEKKTVGEKITFPSSSTRNNWSLLSDIKIALDKIADADIKITVEGCPDLN